MISIDSWALFITALVFTLSFVLKTLFFEPLARAMEKRSQSLDEASDLWDEATRATESAENTIAVAIQDARNTGYSVLDKARGEAQQGAKAELDKARLEAQAVIREGRLALSRQAAQAVKDLEQTSSHLASELTHRILGRDVT